MPLDRSGRKKLKQSRLPFSPIDPKIQKKRKLSSDAGSQSSKALRTEEDVSKKEEFVSSKHHDIEVIEDSEQNAVVEEKENLKSKSSEKIIGNAETNVEDSNDGIELIEIIEKSDSPKSTSKSSPTVKKVKKQESKKVETVNKSKRKRESLSKTPPSNIKKFFKDVEQRQETSGISKKSEAKGESEVEEHTKEKSIIPNPCSKESELNESSESNSTVTNDSSTLSSAGEEKIEDNKNLIAPKTPSQKSSLVNKKLTPKQKVLEGMKKKKQEERLQLKLQKEQEKKEKELERQKLKDERQRKRIEELEMKEKEKEEKKQKKEEERQKRKEEERQKREEEIQKKEEKLLVEKEELEKQKKLKAKFAQFFVPKKVDSQNQAKESENASSDNFVHFRVKDNMKIAPVVRRSLSQKQKEKLEDVLLKPLNEVNYLREVKKNNYTKGKSCQTFPSLDKLEEEDICEIISDDEEIDGTDVLEIKACQSKRLRAKFLQFCENNRPAYYGTWSKKSVHLSGRNPFVKEEIFDYDYDSDEDWEDIENGESLSDSDGEADDGGKEDSNQYEVDNDFFVPHGYLSDGEGEEDEENEEVTKAECNKEKDENLHKERLKQKQEEFELEMKQKTKQVKPKVYGCVWLGDRSSHQAYDQLLKILIPYKSMVMFGTCPINLSRKETNQELKENDDDEGQEDDTGKKFFLKSFPEKAVPDLIRLIHGNRHSKLFLIREFSEYWKRRQGEETDNDSGFIAMRKIEPKIQEIGQYGKFSENGISLKYRTWYVSKEVREKYGLEDLSLNNKWQYALPVKEWKHESKEDKQDKPEESEDPAVPKLNTKSPFTGTNLITKFTKVLHGEGEKKKLFNNVTQSPCSTDASPSPDNPKAPINSDTVNNLTTTPSSSKKGRSKVSLMSAMKEKTESLKSKNSIVAMFKNIEKEKTTVEKKSSAGKDEQLECIILE